MKFFGNVVFGILSLAALCAVFFFDLKAYMWARLEVLECARWEQDCAGEVGLGAMCFAFGFAAVLLILAANFRRWD
jgi:hypothetical protein